MVDALSPKTCTNYMRGRPDNYSATNARNFSAILHTIGLLLLKFQLLRTRSFVLNHDGLANSGNEAQPCDHFTAVFDVA